MRLLVTGARGQIGWELARSLTQHGEVIALDRTACDLSRPQTLAPALEEIRPDVIVNAAAYTAVDDAEEHEPLATVINGAAVGELGEWARKRSALLIHYSTDYVFDGSNPEPYVEADPPNPLNAYGRSKLAGELALAQIDPHYLCLRTSWVYTTRRKNFLMTMLKLGQQREELRVVSDQIGAPTWARNIADATATLIASALDRLAQGSFQSGLFHMTAGGQTSWHGFAKAIFAGARQRGLDLKVGRVEAIDSDAFPTAAKRPLNSRLSNQALSDAWSVRLPPWDEALVESMSSLTGGEGNVATGDE